MGCLKETVQKCKDLNEEERAEIIVCCSDRDEKMRYRQDEVLWENKKLEIKDVVHGKKGAWEA